MIEDSLANSSNINTDPVADELSQHLISSFKYLDPHFHSQTIGPSIVYMNTHRNNGKPLELRMHILFSFTFANITGPSKLPVFSMATLRLHLMVQS
jgi:hypothetical protein